MANNTNTNSGSNVIAFLFELQLCIKMFHWQTTSYAAHKETGLMFDNLIAATDEYVEQYMGTYGRPRVPPNTAIRVRNMDKASLVEFLRDGMAFMNRRVPKDPHLLNLRDEITGMMAKALYLLTLS